MNDDELNQIADELTGTIRVPDEAFMSDFTPFIPINVELMEKPEDFSGAWEPQMPQIEGSTLDNAGMDVFAAAEADWEYVADSIWSVIVHSGLRFELPRGVHLRAASRSGLGFKKNITTFPGTLDSSYRGEFLGKLFAFAEDPPERIEVGDKFVQLIPFRTDDVALAQVDNVDTNTIRGAAGFGSTG